MLGTSLLNIYFRKKVRLGLIFQNFNSWGITMQNTPFVVYFVLNIGGGSDSIRVTGCKC
jgi:hypothetical protein